MREKLIEAIDKARRYAADKCHSFMSCAECSHYGEHNGNCRNAYIAESLIANGVTVQEWISASEPPWMGEEIAKLCIRYMEEYADFHGYASSKKVKAHIVRLLELEKDGRIAILPQPPKGE